MHIRWVFLLTLAVLTLFATPARADAARRVYAGVYLHDLTKFDQKDGVFDVDLELWAKWLGDFDPEKLSIANAAEVEKTLLGQEKDGTWQSARWRVKGTLRGEFPLQRFPFDSQTIAVVLELPEREGELVPDLAGSGMRERFSVTGWLYEPAFVPRVGQETYRSDLGSIAGEGKPTAVHRTAFEVVLSRPLLTAATKLFLPLVVILLVALVALFVHPKELEVRASVGVTALLACFAFHFAVADTMPNVAYITLADVLFLVSYALTAILLCVSVLAYWLDSKDRVDAWKRLDAAALIVFPLLSTGIVVAATHTPKSAHAAPAKVDHGPRPPSTKNLLRVGTNALNTPSGGLPGRGAYWGAVREELGGRRIPVLVEEVPAITNDALRFLADGKLQVTWKLRDGLKWSDGAPLTADDFLFALQVSPDSRIADMRVVSPKELVVKFHDRVAAAMESITPLPKHALDAEFKKGGFEAVRNFRRTNVTPGTGPYKVTEFVVDDHVFLEVNPNFPGPPPSIARIEIRRYPDDKALVAAFESGAIDMIAPNAIGPEAAMDLAKRRPDAVQLRPSELQLSLHPDVSHPLLGKLDVRRALTMAIDRERLRTEVFGSAAEHAKVSHVPVPGPTPPGTVTHDFDPAAAKKMLEAAGAAGATFPLFRTKAELDKAIAARLVKDFAAAGITLEEKEVKAVFDTFRTRKHGGLVLMNTTGDRELQPERFFALPQIEGRYDRRVRNDVYTDAISALVEREERALYPERRDQIRDLLFVEYSKRLPFIPLIFLVDRIVTVPDLDGWEQGSGSKFGRTIERWNFAAPAAPAPAPPPQ